MRHALRTQVRALRAAISLEFSQGVIWSMASLVILAMGGVLANFLIVTLRGSDALGIFNQVYGIYIIISQLATWGLQFSILKQVSYTNQDPQAYTNSIVAVMLVAPFTIVPVMIVSYLLADPIGDLLDSPEVTTGLRLALLGIGFFVFNKILINVLNALNLIKTFAVFRSIRFLFIPIFIIVLILLGFEDAYIPLAFALAELVLFLILAPFIFLRFLNFSGMVNLLPLMGEHLQFGAKSVVSGTLIELSTRLDVLVLGYFASDRIVGIYSFSAILAEGASQISYAVRWSVDPLIGEYFANQQPERIQRAVDTIRKNFFPAFAAICLASMAIYPFIYWFFFPDDEPFMSAIIFAILMIGVLINSRYRPFTGLLLQGNLPGAYTQFMFTLVSIRFVISVILIPFFNVYGIAVATSVAYILEGLLLVWFVRRLLNIDLKAL